MTLNHAVHVKLGLVGPDGSLASTGACSLEVTGSNTGQAEYLSSWLCIYSDANCSKVSCSGLPSVAILP